MGKKYSFKVRLLCLLFLFIVISFGLLTSIVSVQSLNEQIESETSIEKKDNQQESTAEINNRYVGNALTVYSKENFLYVIEENNMLRVYDLSTPRTPKVINSMSIETDNSHQIKIKNEILYLPSRGGTWLQRDSSYYHRSYINVDTFVDIYNLSDPYNIEKIGEFLVLGQLDSFYVDNNFAYIYRYKDYINHTYDGDNFYLEMTNFVLSVYNITNPSNIALIKDFDNLQKYGYILDASEKITFFYNTTYGVSNTIYFVNFTDIYEPKLIETITFSYISSVHIYNNKLFILCHPSSGDFAFVRIYSLTNLSNLVLLNSLNLNYKYSRIEIYQDILYSIESNVIKAYNISDHLNPELLFEFKSETSVTRLFASNNYVIIVSYDRSVTVYDISSLKPKSLTNYQRILLYCGIGLLFLIIPVFHFLYERYIPKKITPKESKETNEPNEGKNTDKNNNFQLFTLISDKHPLNLIYSGYVIFAIQNGIMLFCFIAIFFSFFDSFYEQNWTNILFNILFFSDLIYVLIFAVALILLYLMYRHKMALISAVVWLAWFSVTFAYRFYIGMPEYYPQIAYDLDFQSFRTIGGLFAANVILLWLCFYLMNKYLENFNLKNTLGLTIYGYFNLILGFLMSLGFIYGNEFRYSDGLGTAFFVALVFKSIILPPIAAVIGGVAASNIRNR